MQEVRNVNKSIEISPSQSIWAVTPKVWKFINRPLRINIEIVPVIKVSHSALERIKKLNYS